MPAIGLLGDVMLGRGVAQEIRRHPPERFWGSALPLLRSLDAVFANLECAITTWRQPWSRTPKVFHFGAPPEALAVLRAANVRYVSLANNHVLDFEVEGLQDTIAALDQAGIAHAGAGPTLAEARRPALVDVAGLRIGIVSATDNQPEWAATEGDPGVFYLDLDRDRRAGDQLEAGARHAREQGAALVVLSLHWGPNMVVEPPRGFRRLAHRVAGCAGLLHGHSAHVFQGVQAVPRGLILYDTGDFLDDYAVDPTLRNDWSFVFVVDLSAAGRVERLRLYPVRLDYAVVNLATGTERRAICDRMREQSGRLGTALAPTAFGLELVLPP